MKSNRNWKPKISQKLIKMFKMPKRRHPVHLHGRTPSVVAQSGCFWRNFYTEARAKDEAVLVAMAITSSGPHCPFPLLLTKTRNGLIHPPWRIKLQPPLSETEIRWRKGQKPSSERSWIGWGRKHLSKMRKKVFFFLSWGLYKIKVSDFRKNGKCFRKKVYWLRKKTSSRVFAPWMVLQEV